MKKTTYIQPSILVALLETEQMVANSPATSGLTNPDGSNGDITDLIDDDGSGSSDDGFDGNVKGCRNLWDDVW